MNEIIYLIYIYVDELNNTIQLTSVWCWHNVDTIIW